MSQPRYHWWGYARWMVRDYPAKLEELSAMRSAAPRLDGLPHARAASRTTENLAAVDFTGVKKLEFDAVAAAVRETRRHPDGETRLQFILLYHWKQSHTLRGAAEQLHVSYDTAVNWNRAFIRRVAVHRGLLEEPDAAPPDAAERRRVWDEN